MDLGEVIGLIGIIMGSVVLVAGYAGAWALGRAKGRREALEERLRVHDDDQRLRNLEETMEQVANQMQHLAETQRFTVGLLAERPKTELDEKA